MDNFEQFCRHKALEGAILASADKLERKEYGTVEGLIKEAVEIGLAKDFGTNYWEDPAGRIQAIKDNRGQNTTGWETFDRVLYGGFNPGELNIFAGGSGSGKSLFMQNLALNWSLQGKNVNFTITDYGNLSRNIDKMIERINKYNLSFDRQLAEDWIDCSNIKHHKRSTEELLSLIHI